MLPLSYSFLANTSMSDPVCCFKRLSLLLLLSMQTLVFSSCSSSTSSTAKPSTSRPALELLFSNLMSSCPDETDAISSDDFCLLIRNTTEHTLQLDKVKFIYSDSLVLTKDCSVGSNQAGHDNGEDTFLIQKEDQDVNKKSLAFLSGQNELKAGQLKVLDFKVSAGKHISAARAVIRAVQDGKELDVKLFSFQRQVLMQKVEEISQGIDALKSMMGILSANATINSDVMHYKSNTEQGSISHRDDPNVHNEPQGPAVYSFRPEDRVGSDLDHSAISGI